MSEIHERLAAYARETDAGGQIRAAVAALKTPIWGARVSSVQTIRHLDGTVVPVAIIRPGYEITRDAHGPAVGTWRSMVRAGIEGFGE